MGENKNSKMTYAIITDVHANIFALRKALEIIEGEEGIDRIVCMGDCFSLGSSPVETLDALNAIENIVFIRGNHDRYLVEEIWKYDRPTIEGMDPDDPVCIDIIANEKWTDDQLGEAGKQFIRQMKLSHFETVGNTYVEFTHAWFGRDEMPPTMDEAKRWRDHAANRHPETKRFVFIHGHTHVPRNEQFGNLSVLCPGSTGLPFDEDTRGVVAFLTVEGNTVNWDVRRFEYDDEAAKEHMLSVKPPFYRNLHSTLKYASIRNDLVE